MRNLLTHAARSCRQIIAGVKVAARRGTAVVLLGAFALNLVAPTLAHAAPAGAPQAAAAQPRFQSPVIQNIVAKVRERLKTLEFKTPTFGDTVSAKAYTAVLTVGYQLKLTTLRVYLNGKEITSGVSIDRCVLTSCDVTVRLTMAKGLRAGENHLKATAHGRDGSIADDHVRFDYTNGLGTGDDYPNWLPSAIGLSVTPGGALPWVTIRTGTPASLVDSSDQTKWALPYPDTTMPNGTDPSCASETYQVLVMDRQQPLLSHTYTCYSDSASLTTYLGSLTSSSLVVVGTSWGFNTAAGLDTSTIGGTDYSKTPAATYPQGYVAIGVPGAPAGSAYENYYIAADTAPLRRDPFAHGILAADKWGNYNFFSDTAFQFEVVAANAPGNLGPLVAWSTQTGNTGLYARGYAPPQSGDGLWLLVLDRVTLEAIDANTGNCPLNDGGPCGTFFATGSTDSTTSAAAVSALATAISAVTTRQLAFLVSTGQPFQAASDVTNQLGDAVTSLGGSRFTLGKLTSADSTFVLVAHGLANAPAGTPVSQSPFAQGVAASTNLFTQQGQTGHIRGVLERDTKGLYWPTAANQEDGKSNGSGATNLSLDFSFHQIGDYAPLDWPLTDTTNHIAAYHAVSAQYLSVNYGETGSHAQDLRYFYAGAPQKYSTARQTLNDQSNSNCLATQKLPTGASFTLQDWCDARAQLYQETLALYNTDQYLGETGIQGWIDGKSGIAEQIVGVANNIVSGQLIAPKAPTGAAAANANVSKWLNFASASIALFSIGIAPEDLPFLVGAMSATSGGLRLGSAFSAFDGSTVPLSYENGFDTTLANLTANANSYQENLTGAYGAALDAIYSDWGKLSAIGAKTADSDSGWANINQVSPALLGDILVAGTTRSLYMETLPQFYAIDTYSAQPVSAIDKMGLLSYDAVTMGWSCIATYPAKISADGYGIFPHIGNASTSDILVIGGAIIDQNKESVVESLPSAALLSTLFSAPVAGDNSTSGYLNIPTDPVYAVGFSGGFLTYRNGPSRGNGMCYKPGCTADSSNKCVGP